MRVLHIGKYYAPQRGGIERHLQDLAEWFVAHGHHVVALVHQPVGQWRSRHESLGGVDLCRVGCMAAPLYTPISPAFPWQLRQALRNGSPDLLHLHMPNPSCFAALASPRARTLPWIVHWHADVSPEMPDWRVRAAYRLYRPFERAVLARASAIVVTSLAYAQASVALAPWKAKLHVVPLGIGAAQPGTASSADWPSPGSLKLLSVGRLSHYKGHAVLLEAMARTPGSSLMLVGKGEESARLRALAASLDIENRVSFVGEIDDADLQALYAAADLFVLPSLDRSEAFGLVLVEAMRAGLATVASDIPGSGTGQVIEDAESGILVPPRNPQALAHALERARDPSLRQRLGEAGRLRWQARFTLEKSAQAILQLYRAVLDRHPPAAGPAT
jgi:glycosyltransferase involved in cell wall biosynthesis